MTFSFLVTDGRDRDELRVWQFQLGLLAVT